MIKLCLLGGGNITNLRHIPALRKIRGVKISGLIGGNSGNVKNTSKRIDTSDTYVLNANEPLGDQLKCLPWFMQSDAVLIGTPPQTHFTLTKACLMLGKHVLVEKPMVMTKDEGVLLINLATSNKLILNVMHNFQYSSGIQRLITLIEDGDMGEIKSFYQHQFTSRDRRLPAWYQNLPLGLFYDEAAHFFYLLKRIGGPVKILNAYGHMPTEKEDSTPLMMSVDMQAGGIPAHLSINFNAPVCEWFFAIIGTQKFALYDFFRDILIILPQDGQHLALDILRTSRCLTIQHWKGFFISGFRLVTGRLHYGVDIVIDHFIDSIKEGKMSPGISAESGLETIVAMHQVIEKIRRN
jgi:predicted dehydrogenase